MDGVGSGSGVQFAESSTAKLERAATASETPTTAVVEHRAAPPTSTRSLDDQPELPPATLAGSSPTPFVFSVTAQRRLVLTDGLLRRTRIHDWAQHGDKAFLAIGSAIEDRPVPKKPTASQDPALQEKPKTRRQNASYSATVDKILGTAISEATALTSDVRHVERGAATLDRAFAQIPLPPTSIHHPTVAETVQDLRRALEQERSSRLGYLCDGDGMTTEELQKRSELALKQHVGYAQSTDAGKVRKIRAIWNCYRKPHSISAQKAMKARGVLVAQAPFSKEPWQNVVRPGKHVNDGNDAMREAGFQQASQEDLALQFEQERVDYDGVPEMGLHPASRLRLTNSDSQARKSVLPACHTVNRFHEGRAGNLDSKELVYLERLEAQRHAVALERAKHIQLVRREPIEPSILASEMARVQLNRKRELALASETVVAQDPQSPGKSSQSMMEQWTDTPAVVDLVKTELPNVRSFIAAVRLREDVLSQQQQREQLHTSRRRASSPRTSPRPLSARSASKSQPGGRTTAGPLSEQRQLNPLDVRVLTARKLMEPLNRLDPRERSRLEAYTKPYAGFTGVEAEDSSVHALAPPVPLPNTVTKIRPGAPALRPPLSVVCPPTYASDGTPTMDISRLMAYSKVLAGGTLREELGSGRTEDASAREEHGERGNAAGFQSKDEKWYGPVYYIKPK